MSEEVSSAALEGSHNFEDAQGRQVALYGKIYRASQQTHAIVGRVRKVKGREHHFNFDVLKEDRDSPPEDFASPDLLWELAIGAAAGSKADTVFYGDYRYEQESLSLFPSLPIDVGRPARFPKTPPLTHIAGMRLCNMEGDSINDYVEITLEPDGEITFTVRLKRQQSVNAQLLKRLFTSGNDIASNFVVTRGSASE